MNTAIMNFKQALAGANTKLKQMPEDLLRPKHIKGKAWALADKNWNVTPLTEKQAGFLAGARLMVDGLVEAGSDLLDSAMELFVQNVNGHAMAASATEIMTANGACTAENGYAAEPNKLAEDIKAMCELHESRNQSEEHAYRSGYKAGKSAALSYLDPQSADALSNKRDAEAVKMMTVLGDGFYLTYSKLLKKWIISVEDGKDGKHGKEWDDANLLLALRKAEAATGHMCIPCIYCEGTYETIQPGCCPKNPMGPGGIQVHDAVERADVSAPEQAEPAPQAADEVAS